MLMRSAIFTAATRPKPPAGQVTGHSPGITCYTGVVYGGLLRYDGTIEVMALANVQKFTRGQVGGLTRHFERAKKDNGEYYKFGNQEVDTTRTHLNYNLAPARNQLAFISQRTSEVECVKRADINVMCSWVVTAPKDVDEGELKLFFEEVYKFLNDRYAGGNDNNVVSAYVHMDEVSPHLHYAFVPVTHDVKKDIDKISAKAVINRRELQTFHNDLSRHMTAVFGRDIGILNEATKEGNKSIDELKRGTAQLEMEAIRAEVNDLQAGKESLEAEIASQKAVFKEKGQALINDYEKQKSAAERQLKALDANVKAKVLTKKEIEGIQVKRTRQLVTLGRAKDDLDDATVHFKEWENVKKTAIKNLDEKQELPRLRTENAELQAEIEQLRLENKDLRKNMRLGINERAKYVVLQSKLQNVPPGALDEFVAQYQPKKEPSRTRASVDRDR